ncbi:MAG: short-chain dehydrogenase [Alphaproteobacteria bacterium HGW-Alphaproteobacteria-2]|nr:MAG: short-chain dehydrogenase [Alphaproteobacteria bacterium HGW-Alphaproteobacteria-2]
MEKGWALVTGASEGLGREFARLAASAGHSVILAARNEARLRELAADLSAAHGVEALVLRADLAEPGAAGRLWTEATADGRRISVLVNNAGFGRHGSFGAGGEVREAGSIAVNVTALTELMQVAVPHMRGHGGGRILNVASTAAFMPGPGMAVYHATKAYVLSLSLAAAEELRGTGVTVTALCPGATATRFFADADMGETWLMRLTPVPGPAPVAAAGWRAMLAGRPVAITGWNNRVFAFLTRLVPRPFAARLTRFFLSETGRPRPD